MAVVEQTYAATAPWAVADVCSRLQSAFTDAGLMTTWFAAFASGGREHRVLEIIYDPAKAYGKTYYWFTVSSTAIHVRTSTGWNTSTNIPSGPGVAGTQYVDWGDTDTTALNFAHQLFAIQSTINFTVTRYTSGGRSFFLFRTGTTYRTFTIDPAGTTFKSFYNLELGYHSGIYSVDATNRRVRILSLHRNRRELFLGSSLNAGISSASPATAAPVLNFCIPVNFGSSTAFLGFPDEGFVLPGWTTAANPSAGQNFNPVYHSIRLTSVHAADMPADFGIGSIKISDLLAIQDNANVSDGTEEYKIGAFSNSGVVNGITSNPAFLFRTV
jgi:hypothetical protein